MSRMGVYEKYHNSKNKYCVGEYKDKELGIMNVDIYVDEINDIPHFHVHTGKTLRKRFADDVDYVFCITENKYYIHQDESSMMTPKQLKKLVKFLDSKCVAKGYEKLTNWEAMIEIWNKKYSNKINGVNKRPDYTEILHAIVADHI